MRITVTFKPWALEAARAALLARGLDKDVLGGAYWGGPTFENAQWCTDEDICPKGFIAITTGGAMYLYQLNDIARLKFE